MADKNMDIQNASPAASCDLSGKTCPYTVLGVRKALGPLKKGHILEIIIDYQPAAIESIPNFLFKKGYPFSVIELGDNKWKFIIKKTD